VYGITIGWGRPPSTDFRTSTPRCRPHFVDYTRSPRRCDMSDPLSHIVVGHPDPTSDLDTDNGYRECGFEWFDDTCLTLVLRWQCTREWGHPGQHLAGTGHWVAAVHIPEKPKNVRTDLPTATAWNT
jgi:hypothetical protein